MAKSFIAIKKAIGLYDTFEFGKYINCRVDSIVESDPAYIDYTRINFQKVYDATVLDAVLFSKDKRAKEEEIRTTQGRRQLKKYGIAALFGNYTEELGPEWDDIDEDVPF